MTNSNKEHVRNIIAQTFKVIKKVYDTQKEEFGNSSEFCESGSRIIFPKYSGRYRNGVTRISEQELRFIFVEQFNKYCKKNSWNAYYSVETPTEEKYIFSKKGDKNCPYKVDREGNGGQSAMIDLCIHDDKFERIALIEFKALNPKKSAFAKDFCKLSNEPKSTATFFVMIVKSHDDDTIKSLREKIGTKGDETEFYCYDLKAGCDISEIIKTSGTTSQQ